MSGSGIIPSIGKIQKEISVWETRVAEKEKDASILSIKIQDIKIGLNVFLGKYYSKVGIVYVKLDKLNLRIKEYQHRINLAQSKRPSQEDLNIIEEEIDEIFSRERSKVDSLESEASESSEEYRRHLEEEKEEHLDHEFQKELKKLFRKLALRFHPDRAKDDKQKKEFHKIMAAINEAYKNKDLETLKKYMKQAEREEKIAKETLEEKLTRLKEDYKIILGIIAKLRAELEDLKANETYKLKEKDDKAKKEGRDLLQELATSIKAEISENQMRLDELVAQYKKIIGSLAY